MACRQRLAAVWTSLRPQPMPKMAVVLPSRYDRCDTHHASRSKESAIGNTDSAQCHNQVDHPHGLPSVIYPAGGPPALLGYSLCGYPTVARCCLRIRRQSSHLPCPLGLVHVVGRLHSFGCCGGPSRIRNNGIGHPDTKLEAGHLDPIGDVLDDGLVFAREGAFYTRPMQRAPS